MKKILPLILFFYSLSEISGQTGPGKNTSSTSSVCGVYQIGAGLNYAGVGPGGYSVVSYDKNINTVAFVHRAACGMPVAVTNTGYYTYDVSTDGGITWSVNQGPIYGVQLNPGNGCGGGSAFGPHRGRYPKGVLYNPPGNINPGNAHIAYTGPWNADDGATTNWYGQVHGTGHLDGSPANENYDSLLSGMSIWPEDIFVTKTGVSWIVGRVGLQDAMNTYQDSIAIFKGTWNGSDFIYDYHPIHYRLNSDAGYIPDMKIAFADDGLTGYMVLLTNQDSTYLIYPDSTYYPQVFKTTDGGTTWSCPQDLIVAGALDSAFVIMQGVDRYNLWTDMDIVVDKNNNLHIFCEVIPNAGFNSYYQTYQNKSFGLVDFYTTDQGLTYKAQLIAHPQTFFSTFGTPGIDEVQDWLRPFASRIWDGSKLYFGWFETDTMLYGVNTNDYPDLHLIGYDVDNNLWTSDLSNLMNVGSGENITNGSSAGGICFLGNGSYYATENGPTPSIPVVYQHVTDFFYIDCAAPTGTFSFQGHPLNIPTAFNSPLCADGDGVVLSAGDLTKDLIVSSNYPNPFTGKTFVDVTLAKAGDVTIEIRNVVGQTVSRTNYQKLKSGLNTLTIDAATLSHGLYFFTVKAGTGSVTRTMSVE
jgi:hypothetical protein